MTSLEFAPSRLMVRMVLRGLLCLVLSLPFTAEAQRLFTVVIDAGHGGKDSGTVGNGGKEKDITLAVAKLVGAKIRRAHPEVNVLYTRTTDVFVGLQARADYANKHKASLMLSIHVNSAPSKEVHGTETYVLGIAKFANNLSVAMRENKAMLLESDYKTTYRGFDPTSTESYIMFDLMQDAYFNKSIELANKIQRQYRAAGRYSRGVRQDILWVLSQSAMPSILTEIGFLSNQQEAAFMLSEDGQQTIASAIALGFTSHYRAYRGKGSGDKKQSDSADTKTKSETEADTTDQDSTADTSSQEETQQTSPREQVERALNKGGGKSSSKQGKTSTAEGKTKASVANSSDSASDEGITYRVQFLSSPEKIDVKDARFRKLPTPVERVKVGKAYIYLLSPTPSKAKAQQQLSSLPRIYRDAYIARYRGTKRL